MGDGKTPDAPDYGPLAEVQKKLGKMQVEFQREVFDWGKKQAGKLIRQSDRIVRGQLKTDRENRQWARQQRERYDEVFKPIEDKLIREAERYDTKERREQEAGRAISDVGQAFDASHEAAERRLTGYGIDPSMLRRGSIALSGRLDEATAKAQAGNDARHRVEDVGRALRADVVNLGRGVPSQVAQAYATSTGAAGTAAGTGQGAVATGSQALTAPATYGYSAGSAYQGASQTMNYGYQNELASYEANQQYGLPGLLRTGAGLALGRFGFDEGGDVKPRMSPSRGALPDDVPASLSVGEVVVPKEVVDWKGREFFEKLKERVAKDKQQRRAA